MTGAADLTPHARRELDALSRVRGPGQAEAVLTIHQRRDGGGACLCGWRRLGETHAGHQAAELRNAGLLVPDDPTP